MEGNGAEEAGSVSARIRPGVFLMLVHRSFLYFILPWFLFTHVLRTYILKKTEATSVRRLLCKEL